MTGLTQHESEDRSVTELGLSLLFFSHWQGLKQKAEALYSKGNFEFALVFYQRGYKLRPEMKEFRLGIQKAQEAIENSIGGTSKVP